MTVPIYNLLTQYTGTGSRTFFEYGFEVFSDTNVLVLVNGAVVTFTMQETGVVIDPAPALDATILIYRQTDVTQLRDFQPFEAFKADKTESAVDKLIYLKQEALIYRALMNLYPDPYVDRVVILNDKGTDATIYLWDLGEAGMFSGQLGALPNPGTQVEKPEDFAYFQCDGGGGDTYPDYDFIIIQTGFGTNVAYIGFDLLTGDVQDFGTFPAPYASTPSVVSDGTYVFVPSSSTATAQYVWRGHVFSRVLSAANGAINGSSYMVRLDGHDNYVVNVGTEASGHGMRATEYVTEDPYSYPSSGGKTATDDYWAAAVDLRYGNAGAYAYGDALVTCPQNGNDMYTYEVAGTTFTQRGVYAAGVSSLGNSQAYGWDRDLGLIATHFTAATNFDLYQVDMADLATITKIGNVGTTSNNILAIGIAPNGVIVTAEETGATDAIRTYIRDGLTLTLADEYVLSGGITTNSFFQNSPYTGRVWLFCSNSSAGLIAMRIDVAGLIAVDLEYTGADSFVHSFGNLVWFLGRPLNVTSNGFTGIKEKLYEHWSMDETGSVTRVGSMGNFDLPVYVGTCTNRTGVINDAVDFTGSSALGNTPGTNPLEMAGTGTFSFCVDVKFDTLGAVTRCVFARTDNAASSGANIDWALFYVHTTARIRFSCYVGSSTYYAEANDLGAPTTGVWYHCYCEWDVLTKKIKVRVNGGDLNEAAVPSRMNTGGDSIRVGRLSSGSGIQYYLDGAVDNLFFFYDALTATEQDFMYNSGNSRAFADL